MNQKIWHPEKRTFLFCLSIYIYSAKLYIAKISNTRKQNFQVLKCTEPRCGLCKLIKEGSTFSFKGKNFTVNADMSCTVKNVMYVIECRGCQKYYIGETNNLSNQTTLHN